MNSLKRVINWLRFNKSRRKNTINNKIFEIPFNKEKTNTIYIPNIQNKAFKISKWFVKVGDVIKDGQLVCELETNSITIELESFHAGQLVMITKSKEKLKAGNELCKIEEI